MPVRLSARRQFEGNRRFELRHELGAGAMGVVYQAYDRERRALVALKTLRHLDPLSIYRLKREFRSLVDLQHPNLVALHELFFDEGVCFFTMELVAGNDLLTAIRNGPAAAPDDWSSQSAISRSRWGDGTTPMAAGPRGVAMQVADLTSVEGLARLRAVMKQLAEGVAYLHANGKLHRDLKPSNVRVTPAGRVAILDFGLVKDLDMTTEGDSLDHHVVGTAAYMSPEQGASMPLGPASDWYSVGVMLFAALTGRLPFIGRSLEILMDKHQFEPPAPRELSAAIPEDLNSLCVGLLRRRPDQRPDARAVLRRLGSVAWIDHPVGTKPTLGHAAAAAQQAPFVGRQSHLEILHRAYADVREGRAVRVYVTGQSGIGKSAMVRRFLDEVERSGKAVVLTGRCYERESVPYKALDSLLDALSRFLSRQSKLDTALLMPRDVPALARVFPGLRRVPFVADARWGQVEDTNPQELRRRAFAALRELLARLADRQPLVLHIDDLQWGDADSAILLTDLLMPPDAPPLLLVASFRAEDAETSPLLRALLQPRAGVGAGVDARTLTVGPLADAEVRELVPLLFGAEAPTLQGHVDAIVRESGGNPYFVGELTRYLLAGGSAVEGAIDLATVLKARFAHLSERALRFLQVIAVAGHPVTQEIATRATRLTEDLSSELALLRTRNLVRTRGTRAEDTVECFHDRIRHAVLDTMNQPERQERHLRLALELEHEGLIDPESLAVHFRAAGEIARAAGYAAAAAAEADEALAFERAATLYELTLELQPPDAPKAQTYRIKLGDALVNAGRGTQAAEVYAAAAVDCRAAEKLELQRRAAEQLLISGRIDEGLASLRKVLAAVGMRLPRSPMSGLASLLLLRARLALRGHRFRVRDPSQISEEELTRIDVCGTIGQSLGFVSPIIGAVFQSHQALLALRAGEPLRVANGLAVEACYMATRGHRSARATKKLLAKSFSLAEQTGEDIARGIAAWGMAGTSYLQGEFAEATQWAEKAQAILRECRFAQWALSDASMLWMWASYYHGSTSLLAQHLTEWLKEADRRGNAFVATNLRTGTVNVAWLLVDEPARAREAVAEARGRWTNAGYHVQHYDHMFALGQIDLYEGQGRDAWQRTVEGWPALKRSLLLTVRMVRVEALHLRGRAAVATAAELPPTSAEARQLRRSARRDARRIERTGEPWGKFVALLLRAAIAHQQREHERQVELLTAAVAGFEECRMGLFAAAARRRLGEALGGEEGRQLQAQADTWMQVQGGVRNPRRMTAMITAGLEPRPPPRCTP